jgi:hypothetical protein
MFERDLDRPIEPGFLSEYSKYIKSTPSITVDLPPYVGYGEDVRYNNPFYDSLFEDASPNQLEEEKEKKIRVRKR